MADKKVHQATYYAENREKMLAKQKEYMCDPEKRARSNARRVEHRKENPEALLRYRLRHREWDAANRKKVREYQATFRAKNRDFVRNLKTACITCGEAHPGCLDFHHRDPSAKEGTIARLVARGVNLDRLKSETDKCDVLCANCHRKLHWGEASG